MNNAIISNVSDTALWVAAFRAKESLRPDALYHDEFAGKLAGEKGFKIVDATPGSFRKIMGFVMAIRTVAIDRLIHNATELGIDTVVNLGAGLDTRPYRIELPASLQWVEVDMPGMISYKETMLNGEQPRCRLRRISADLSNATERTRVFDQLKNETTKALVITEGLIPYLTNEDAAALSRAIYAVPSFRYWIQDYRQGEQAMRRHPQQLQKLLVNAPFRFTELYPIKFFGNDGWKVKDIIYMYDEGARVRRKFPFPFPWNLLRPILNTQRPGVRESYGYVMFEK
jgi:methyltransferase (TIGR00027 family)